MTPSAIRLVSTGALTTKRLCFNIWVVLFHFDKIFLCIVSTVCPGKTRNEWRVAVLPLRYHRLLFLCWTCNFTKVSKRWGGGVEGGLVGTGNEEILLTSICHLRSQERQSRGSWRFSSTTVNSHCPLLWRKVPDRKPINNLFVFVSS